MIAWLRKKLIAWLLRADAALPLIAERAPVPEGPLVIFNGVQLSSSTSRRLMDELGLWNETIMRLPPERLTPIFEETRH